MPNRKRMSKCHDGKQAYPTLEAAQAAAAIMAHRKARHGNPIVTFLRAYECACGKFHFGKTKDIDWSQIK